MKLLTAGEVSKLPSKVILMYLLYVHSLNPKELLSEGTYYKHKKILLEHGIDISEVYRPDKTMSLVIKTDDWETIEKGIRANPNTRIMRVRERKNAVRNTQIEV